MIHGIPNEFSYAPWLYTGKDWTDGCISVTNQEMDEIWAHNPRLIKTWKRWIDPANWIGSTQEPALSNQYRTQPVASAAKQHTQFHHRIEKEIRRVPARQNVAVAGSL